MVKTIDEIYDEIYPDISETGCKAESYEVIARALLYLGREIHELVETITDRRFEENEKEIKTREKRF